MDAQGHSAAEEAIMLDDAMDAPPIVRFDERRMHIRAYNYWASLLGDRSLPNIEDLNPAEIHDFGSHSVLLDFTSGIDDPTIAFLGSALAAQCDLTSPVSRVSQIPARTLLSRITDHYLQIIANAAPIGFEAEFTNQRGAEILYRGIMMPFSTDDDTIDFVYGVINWKEVVTEDLADSIAAEVAAAGPGALAMPTGVPVWSDGPTSFDLGPDDGFDDLDETPTAEDGMWDNAALDLTPDLIDHSDSETALGDSLAQAREAAAAANASEGRTRHALYRAIGLAHAFAAVAAARPDDYAELLADSGIEVQPRSPLTALAKLVFGADYDKTRLAEFVCAIDHALAEGMEPGALTQYLHSIPGGLKGLVASVRARRRGASVPTRPAAGSRARRKLRGAGTITPEALPFDETGLAVVILRRDADGQLAMVAALDQEDRLTGRVYAAAARKV
ncbi:hypothetical protein SLG_00160 [Sphingobium sp. SYK-6]|nr:hypothetical protein SLG_00160 [Sphingobium sp. SYK-6]